MQIVICLIADLNSEMTLLVTWHGFITGRLTGLPSIAISDATDCFPVLLYWISLL
jgi:hypothetical protein